MSGQQITIGGPDGSFAVYLASPAAGKGPGIVAIHRYPKMNHAFARPGGKHYDQASAGLANSRTATFFRQHLS